MNRTKIICTVGPSVESDKKIEDLAKKGMSVMRLNCSHGNADSRLKHLQRIRRVEKKLKKSIGVMLDLQGPKLRIGDLPHPFKLERNEIWEIGYWLDPCEKDRHLPIGFKGLSKAVKVGDYIFMDDGLLRAQIVKKNARSVQAKIIHGGILVSRKGLNIPYYKNKHNLLSLKDKKDLKWGLDHRVNFVALSFVRSPKDIIEVRNYIKRSKVKHPPLVIAKIEKPEAVENIDEIIDVSDGILIARGDLGIELCSEKVPVVQKQIIERCRFKRKPVIVATQMLDSMREYPIPTRAEASDVASAIFAGSDAVLLTGETSAGKYPVETTHMMSKIITEVENHMVEKTFRKTRSDFNICDDHEALLFNAMGLADDIKAKAIVMLTRRGVMTKIISKLHPKQPIFSLALNETYYRQMSLYWGVFPIRLAEEKVHDRVSKGVSLLKKQKTVKKGDKLVFIYRDYKSQNLNLKVVYVD